MSTTPYHTHHPILGSRLWVLALRWSRDGLPTQAVGEVEIASTRGRKQVIHGSRSKRAAREAVTDAARDIMAARDERQARHDYRAGKRHYLQWSAETSLLPPYLCAGYRVNARWRTMPAGTPADRLPARIEREVRAVSGHYSYGSLRVRTTAQKRRVTVARSDAKDWNYYPKSCWYPHIDTTTTVTVQQAWLSQVRRRGLAEVDGLTTLWAEPAVIDVGDDPVELYSAVWLCQSRGNNVVVKNGAIAIGEGISYHGADERKALAGWRRKRNLRDADARVSAAVSHLGLDEMVARNADLPVRMVDATATGACRSGIESWCYRVGIDPNGESVPLVRVYAAYEATREPYARATILHALRSRRNAIHV